MSVQPASSSASPSIWGEIYQVPGRISRDILLRARELCLNGDIQQFRDLFDSAQSSSENFHIDDFGIIMEQAVEQDNVNLCGRLWIMVFQHIQSTPGAQLGADPRMRSLC